ncbi:hypothetical protein I4U23_022961 [Adineta vaga]|nr:hypothetical protein I4U23_022961 [Adineta vaga]
MLITLFIPCLSTIYHSLTLTSTMMNTIQQQWKIYLVIISYVFQITVGGHHQRFLLRYLLKGKQHSPLERPVCNDTQTLPVRMNLALQQIINFDAKNEVILISGWMVLTWNDCNLKWNPKDYGGIQTIRLPSTQIWIPDILLYNSADEKFDSTLKVNAVVQHTGDILYVPPGIFKPICSFNIASFPFDTQHCTLKFGSWTFDDAGINLTAESNEGQLDAYIKNGQWSLEEFSAVVNVLKYDCCPTLYPFVLYTIRIRRCSLYYFFNIVVPCFLISCMTVLGFLLAPDSGEKLTLQITILLSVIMFSLLMFEIMPPSSTTIPIISKYFMCIMTMSTVSVVASVLVISVHFRNSQTHTMPLWVNINNINGSVNKHHSKYQSTALLDDILELSPVNHNIINVDNLDNNRHPYSTRVLQPQHSTDLSNALNMYQTEMIRSELRTITSHLTILSRRVRRQEKYNKESEDWKFVAMIIDRLCLILFTASNLFSIPKLLHLR